jgi:hypothetical protein
MNGRENKAQETTRKTLFQHRTITTCRTTDSQSQLRSSELTAFDAGNAVIPWAITKDEKTKYDSLFKSCDSFNKGFIGGDVTMEVFGRGGLEKPDLERILTFADHENKGRLNMDEFAVAMHLIYRKLNGYPILALDPNWREHFGHDLFGMGITN